MLQAYSVISADLIMCLITKFISCLGEHLPPHNAREPLTLAPEAEMTTPVSISSDVDQPQLNLLSKGDG